MVSCLALLLCIQTVFSLQLPPVISLERKLWIAEAEKKHERVAMLAFPTLLTIAATSHSDPLSWLNEQNFATQSIFYGTAGALETLNLKRMKSNFRLKDGEIPGKLLFPQFNATNAQSFTEDTVGRLAMIGTLALLLDPSLAG
jgi:hypothetical protein